MAKQISAAKYTGYLVKCPKCKAKSFISFEESQKIVIYERFCCPFCKERTYKNWRWKKVNYMTVLDEEYNVKNT